MLFFIGLIFATFALIKGYTSDDRYPGYGKVDRLYKEAKSDYENAKSDFLADINAAVDRNTAELDAMVQQIRRSVREYGGLINRNETVVEEYSHYSALLGEACNTLLRVYRDTNTTVRAGEPPAYFSEHFSFGGNMSLPPFDSAKERGKLKAYEEEVGRMDERVRRLHEKLRIINQEALDSVNQFFADTEREADRQLVEEASPLTEATSPVTEAN